MCPTGKTTRGSGARSPDECVTICAPGQFGAQGLEPCVACGVGTYSATAGSTVCISCPAGFTTATSGQSSASSCSAMCPAGTRSSAMNGLPPCVSCPAGSYATGLGSSACTECKAGTTTISSEERSVTACKKICDAGSVGDFGVSPCSPCNIGEYQPVMKSSVCLVRTLPLSFLCQNLSPLYFSQPSLFFVVS